MNLRELFEAHHKATAAFCFGRFNPAHQGHAKVWNAVANAGQHWYIGTNPTTIGPNDPLPFDVKTAWMTAIDPKIKGHVLGEKSVVTLASKIYEKVGDNATVAYVTDAQDWAWSGKLLHDYNGKEGPHGYYNFAKIIHVESPRVTSATDLRNAARAGNMELFYKLAGTNPDLKVNGKHYFDTVAEACGHHPEKVKRAKKEKALAEKSTSEKQARFMAAAAHDPKFASRVGIKQSVAKEFNKADTGTKQLSNAMKHKKKTEDAAGVGTITKQNSTVDVNKNTPAKNLRAFNLIKETNQKIRERKRALAEGGTTPKSHGTFKGLDAELNDTLPGVWVQRQLRNTDPYMQYRYALAIAAARADAAGHIDFEQESAWSENLVIVGYTPEDAEVIKMADKLMGVSGTRLADDASRESTDVSTHSPVATPKRNKYGI
jgi:hypothetical protein